MKYEESGGIMRAQLAPMMITIAEQCNSNSGNRNEYHKIVVQYFIDILIDVNEKYGRVTEERDAEYIEKLKFHETNIWNCIYRALHIKNSSRLVAEMLDKQHNSKNSGLAFQNFNKLKTEKRKRMSIMSNEDFEYLNSDY